MNKHTQLISDFYTAFQRRDHQAMAACYHPEARFCDPVFELQGQEIAAMWQMLCERAQDFSLTFSVDDSNGKIVARWQAKYLFSQTGRAVVNNVTGNFTFKDGLIYTHDDDFSFWRWSAQALGAPGLLLGWTPLLRNKVRQQAGKGLQAFIKQSFTGQTAA